MEEGARMRFEGEDAGRCSELCRAGARRSDDRPMAAMHPVEIAQREDRATERIIGRGIAHDAKAFRRHRVSMVKEPLRVGAALGGPSQAPAPKALLHSAGNRLLPINRPFNHTMLASLGVQGGWPGALDH